MNGLLICLPAGGWRIALKRVSLNKRTILLILIRITQTDAILWLSCVFHNTIRPNHPGDNRIPHYDPYCMASSWHGCTTVVVGNCGFSLTHLGVALAEVDWVSFGRNFIYEES